MYRRAKGGVGTGSLKGRDKEREERQWFLVVGQIEWRGRGTRIIEWKTQWGMCRKERV